MLKIPSTLEVEEVELRQGLKNKAYFRRGLFGGQEDCWEKPVPFQ
jgi:hypothetical protein